LLSREVQDLADEAVTVVWPRLFFLFGEGDRRQRVIPHIIRDVVAGRGIDWISPDLRRDYLHADEAAAAMVHLLFAGAAGVVNVASGAAPSMRELARIVATTLGISEPQMASPAAASLHPQEIRADVSKLRRLGWVPSRTVADALESLSRASATDH
jgi:nucleoside-diphosphate-sugar epimerase